MMTGRDLVDSLPPFSRAAMLSEGALKRELSEGALPEGPWTVWWGPNGNGGWQAFPDTAAMAEGVRAGILQGWQVSALECANP